MKLKKLIAGFAAGAVALSTMAVSAFAAEDPIVYFGGGLDDWAVTFWWDYATGASAETNAPSGTVVEATPITGDGQYTTKVTLGEGADPFTWTVAGLYMGWSSEDAMAEAGVVADAEDMSTQPYQIKIDEIKFDGTAIDYDYSKALYYAQGQEMKLELVNIYNTEAPNDLDDVGVFPTSEIEVTFTVSGFGGGSTTTEEPSKEEAPSTEEPSTEAPSTGLAGVALVGLALSGAAAVASKKRK